MFPTSADYRGAAQPECAGPSLNLSNVVKQGRILRVGEAEPVALFEPVNGVMLVPLPVRNGASPPARHPHGEVQADLGIDVS
jgi:hypothetical protein